METRVLGAGRLEVTRLGFGLAAAGRPGYINLGHAQDLAGHADPAALEARAADLLDAAWSAGIRYFDAARSYGHAEAFLGRWLRARQIPPAAVAVGSKWGYTYTAAWRIDAAEHEVKDHSAPVLERQWRETQAELGDYLDLYQIHSATLESGVLEDAAVLRALVARKAAGTLIGLSLSGSRQAETLERALRVEVDGVALFDSVQATWNVLEPAAGPALAAAHAHGLGVIVKEALANGRLTPRNTDPAFAHQREVLVAEASRLQTNIDALALAAVLAQPWADVVLCGAATVATLRSNVAALNVAWDDAAADALGALAEETEQYWATRKGLRWN